MSNFLIALLFSLGAATWIYSKMMNRTGGNTKDSLISAGVSAVAIFIFILVVLGFVENLLD